jgi:hypothetical protein
MNEQGQIYLMTGLTHVQSSPHGGRHCGHPFWRVAQVEQFRLLQTPVLLSIWSAYSRHHHDLLDMWGVDKELHLDASALHHVPEDEGRVGTASSDGDEHAGKGRRRMCEVDGEHRARADAIWMCSREEGADDLLLFCGRECLLEICHETLAIAKGCPGSTSGSSRYYSKSRVRVRVGECRERPPGCDPPCIEYFVK